MLFLDNIYRASAPLNAQPSLFCDLSINVDCIFNFSILTKFKNYCDADNISTVGHMRNVTN
jgi:hypothetical protein